jgi:membrane protein YqaA with SNARE-associated domain
VKSDPPTVKVFKEVDDMILWPWFASYGIILAALVTGLVMTVSPENWQAGVDWHAGQSWGDRAEMFKNAFGNMTPEAKMLGFALYLCLCSAVMPLPTSWIISVVAIPELAIGGSMLTTVLLVTAIGSVSSVIANCNDYHIFTWMLRHHHLAKLRHTRLYNASAGWFAKQPFFILVLFNVLPIPIDVVRILAITYRYPRLPFALANFIGRAIRYSLIAALTYKLGNDKGWVAVVVLLGIAMVLSGERLLRMLFKRLFRRGKTEELS